MTLPLDPDRPGWFTSTRSKDGEDCVEVNIGAPVGVRDSKAKDAGVLAVSLASWSALLADLQAR